MELEEFAKRAGSGVTTLSRLECGKGSPVKDGKTGEWRDDIVANPSIDLLNRVAKALGVSMVDLFKIPAKEKKPEVTHRERLIYDLNERVKMLEPGELNPLYALIVKLTEGRYTHLLGFNRKPVPPLKEK